MKSMDRYAGKSLFGPKRRRNLDATRLPTPPHNSQAASTNPKDISFP